MKNKILYIGNKLSLHNQTVSTIETLGNLLEKEGFVVYYASSIKNKLLRFIDIIVAIIRFRKEVKYILIDVYSTSNFWYAYVCSQLSRFLKIKYIPILHGGNLGQRLIKNPNLCRMIFDNSYKNVSPSLYLKEIFEAHKIDNIIFIPNSIELENYPFLIRQNCVPKLLWVRSFHKIYNPMMALNVIKEIQKEFPEASLCMIGPDKDGSLQQLKKIAIKENLNISFTGKLEKTEWIKLSKYYSIFINTSHFDNMPVSIIEAMSLGLPVISTNVGGIPFIISDEETGLLVEDSNVEAMANAVKKIIKNPELALNLSQNGRKKTLENDWKEIRNQWISLLS